jgi:pimeloyl-ACP methyl ester carboxylesterase
MVSGKVTINNYAEDLHELLDELNVKNIVVAGLSMGGYIALEFYRKYPKYVRALILANTQASVDSAKAKKGRDDNSALAREKGVPALAQKLMPKMLASITMQEKPETVKSVSAMMSRQSVDGVVGALLAMRDRYDSMVTLKQISVPTLIITGLEDKLITSKKSELMRDMISGAKLVVLVDAGHLSNIDQPDAFNQAVNDFLSTVTL